MTKSDAPATAREPINDLRDWLKQVEAIGELTHVHEPVERDEEMSAISYLVAKQKPSPAILFDTIKGFEKSPIGARSLWNVLGPSVRRGDDEFFAIVKWVVFALIEAEEYGITQANVDQMKTSQDPVVQRILGVSEDTGKLLGLDKDWAYRAIKAVGNYGEIFERNVGPKTALKLPRGANNLWNKGGFMYAPPVRCG